MIFNDLHVCSPLCRLAWAGRFSHSVARAADLLSPHKAQREGLRVRPTIGVIDSSNLGYFEEGGPMDP